MKRNVQIFTKVRKTIKRYEMLEKGDSVLLCVSGGPDSVFLVHSFLYLGKEFGVRLFIANLDHGIRGIDSVKDSLFVKRIAEKNHIKLFFKKLKLKADGKHSIEEIARRDRYDFFKSVSLKSKISRIATAHTLDDQAETVLMRVIKGTSLKGITGIPPVRSDGSVSFIRPLIELEKRDIVAFLKKGKISYRIDKTNLENKYLRNAIRNNVIPYLERYNPRLKRALSNLADTLREDREFIEQEKEKGQIRVSGKKNKAVLYMKDIVTQPVAIRKEVVRDTIAQIDGNIKKLTFDHWRMVDSLIRSMPSGKVIELPGRIVLKKEKALLVFEKHSAKRKRK